MKTIRFYSTGVVIDEAGNNLQEPPIQDITPFLPVYGYEEDQGVYVEFTEAEYAAEFGDYVFCPFMRMDILRYRWAGEERQVFIRQAHNSILEGWATDANGTPADGVTRGNYRVYDENGDLVSLLCYFMENRECNNPVHPTDLLLVENEHAAFLTYVA